MKASAQAPKGRTKSARSSTDPAVALIVFNRPEKTKELIDAIRIARPSRILVIGDGPRTEVPTDMERVRACRQQIDSIDWPCRVERQYSEKNLGCRRRVSSGIDWVFERVDRAIFLEDDCIPDPSFFRYCSELLRRFEDEPRVMSISGGHFGEGRQFLESYSFSRYVRVWGWATWRRAWKLYDVGLSHWAQSSGRQELAASLFADRRVRGAWARNFDRILQGFDTWDYQWVYTHLIHGGLSIVPTVNLVRNIGFDADATHTRRPSIYEAVTGATMDEPLLHPTRVLENRAFDARLEGEQLVPPFARRVANLVRGTIGRSLRGF